MTYHIISDDFYFSIGFKTILEQIGETVNFIYISNDWTGCGIDGINIGNVVFVSVSSQLKIRNILERMACIGAVVILFIETPRVPRDSTLQGPVWVRNYIPKRLPVNDLIPTIRDHCDEKIKIFDFNELTEREKKVMGEVIAGKSVSEISRALNIKIKTVYSHRRNALIKIANTSSHYYYLIKYKSYMMT